MQVPHCYMYCTYNLAASPLQGSCTSTLLKILLAYLRRWWMWLTSLLHRWNSFLVSSCPVPRSTWGWYTPAWKSNSCRKPLHIYTWIDLLQESYRTSTIRIVGWYWHSELENASLVDPNSQTDNPIPDCIHTMEIALNTILLVSWYTNHWAV